jgi:hypothetical protein
MRAAASVLFATLVASSVQASSPVEEQFKAFDLFGTWAAQCDQPATPGNPHVSITMPNEGTVLEEHDLGTQSERNIYSVLSASRMAPARLSVEVIFRPGAQNEERQKLVFLIRNGTRRTMFNQPDGGEVRVKDGVALAHRIRTPVLKKCD